MEKTKVDINLSDFPAELHAVLRDVAVYDSSCRSDAKVYYLDSGVYLKVGKAGTLRREAEMASHFYRMGLGVEMVSYISGDQDYMLTKGAVGEDGTHWIREPKLLCRVMAETMRMLHEYPVTGNVPELQEHPVPQNCMHEKQEQADAGITESPVMQHYRHLAEAPYRDGEFVDYVIMDKFKVNSRQEAWEMIQANKDKLKSDTLIHGDFCLPNIVLQDGKFRSLIDLGAAGMGDKHMDIYWALWSLQYNLKTEEYTDYFLDLYGRDNFDPKMLRVIAAFECFGE